MISGGDKSMTICTRQRGQRKHREESMNTFLKKSKKRLMAKFYRLVEQIERVARKLAGSNYN